MVTSAQEVQEINERHQTDPDSGRHRLHRHSSQQEGQCRTGRRGDIITWSSAGNQRAAAHVVVVVVIETERRVDHEESSGN